MPLSEGSTSYPLCTLRKTKHDKAVLYELELHLRPDNRLTTEFINDSILPALDDVERDWRAAVQEKAGGASASLITYGPRDKDRFYSNGLNLPVALATPMFFPRVLNVLLARFLTFPIPTVAALNGHCFAGGLALALAHDYRVMKDTEGRAQVFCAFNEIDFGASIPLGMMAVAKAKLTDATALRVMVLEGRWVGAKEALSLKVVDALGKDGDEVVRKAAEIGLKFAPKAKEQAWGLIKGGMYREAIIDLAIDRGSDGMRAPAPAKL